MILYHGSPSVVGVPVFGKGSLRNDYGRGFYCTEDIDLAREWACISGVDGFANRYDLDVSGLNIVNLNGAGYHILNWLAVLVRNRTYWENSAISEDAKNYLQRHFYPASIKDADVIRGYRANDSYFTFAKAFVANGISVQQLSLAMRLGNLGEQVVLMSKRAFDQIEFLGVASAESSTYTPRALERDRAARRAYRTRVQKDKMENGLYMIDIMRKGMTNEDFLQSSDWL